MLIPNSKISKISKTDNNKHIYNIVLAKTRKGKKIELAIIVWGNLAVNWIVSGKLKIGTKYDFSCYAYSKERIYKGKYFYDTFIVASNIQEHRSKAQIFKEVVNQKTGEVIKLKNQF